MAKLIASIPNGDGWREYARRMAHYGAQLRALGLPLGHPERERAKRSFRRAVTLAQHESWKCRAARRIIRILGKIKAPETVGLLGGAGQ